MKLPRTNRNVYIKGFITNISKDNCFGKELTIINDLE